MVYGKLFPIYHEKTLIQYFLRMLTSEEIKHIYPGKIQRKDDKRIFVMNTMFNLAETCLVAQLINYFESLDDVEVKDFGRSTKGKETSFASLFEVVHFFNFLMIK